MADIAVGGFTGSVCIGTDGAGGSIGVLDVRSLVPGFEYIFREIAPEPVRVGKSVSTDVRKSVDIGKGITGYKVNKAGTGMTAHTVVAVVDILV
jgi:hypothetical protein